MNDDKLFNMVERCVADAVLALKDSAPLAPFAKMLRTDGTHLDIACDTDDDESCYTRLQARLKAEVQMGDIDAVALCARVTIPEHCNAPTPQGLRIHIEEKALRDQRLSARLLYVPYALISHAPDTARSVLLHNPIAIGMPMEIYTATPAP